MCGKFELKSNLFVLIYFINCGKYGLLILKLV